MDDLRAKVSLNEWNRLFNRAYVALEHAKHQSQPHWAAYRELERVLPLRPEAAPISQVQSMKLVSCLEHACFLVPANEEDAGARRRICAGILGLLDPWRCDEQGNRSSRRFDVAGLVIRANDKHIFNTLLELPGAPTLDQMLERGWMIVDPEKVIGRARAGRAPVLPANTGPLPTSIRWLALIATRAAQPGAGFPAGHLSVAEEILVSEKGVCEPLIGDWHLLEFALPPRVVERLVGMGADPAMRTQLGQSCLESAIRRPEASPQSIMGLARLALPGAPLGQLPDKQRVEMAEAVADVFMDEFPSQGLAWPEMVRGLCGETASALAGDGTRLVDKIARRLATARQIDDNPVLMLEQLGVDPATAGEGKIDGVAAWLVWEWLVLHYKGGGGPENRDRGMFCRAAGKKWSPAMMLGLVGKGLVDIQHQASFIIEAIGHDGSASLEAGCRFFQRLARQQNPGLNLEFDVSVMLAGLAKHATLADAPTRVAGSLAPWIVLFDKPLPVVELDPAGVLEGCQQIDMVTATAKNTGDFLGKQRETMARVEALRAAANMAMQTPMSGADGPRPRF